MSYIYHGYLEGPDFYFIVDGPDGDTGSIPRGSAVWPMDRMEAGAVSLRGLLYG